MANRGLSALSVLVIDDNYHMLSLMRTILQGFGVTSVMEATDPAEAFERFQSSPIDVIFVDLKMPVLDGVEFIRLVRSGQDSPNPTVPIIVVSAYSEKSRILEARDAGATEFVRKPLSADEIYKKLHSVVIRPRAFVRAKMFFGPDRRRHKNPDHQGQERRSDDNQVKV